MITLIHGDDIVTSRNYFLSEKQKYPNSNIYSGKELELTDLIEAIAPRDLFFEQKAVFIENLSSKKELFPKLAESKIDVFLWEGKEISSLELNKLKIDIKLFKLPQALFSFLDNIKPNSPQNVSLFKKALDNASEDMIFYMLIRQLRLLLAISDGESIDEVKRIAPWQKTKLLRQASLFSKEDLKKIYNKLFDIDYKIKSGQLPMPLSQALDLLLIEL